MAKNDPTALILHIRATVGSDPTMRRFIVGLIERFEQAMRDIDHSQAVGHEQTEWLDAAWERAKARKDATDKLIIEQIQRDNRAMHHRQATVWNEIGISVATLKAALSEEVLA